MRLRIRSKNYKFIRFIPVLIVLVIISAQSLVAETVIVAIGDSITYGGTNWQLLGHKNTVMGGWVTRLRNKLAEDFPGGYQIINKGINGDTSNGIFSRLNRDVIDNQPDIVIIGIGTNDTYGYAGVNKPSRNSDDYQAVMTDIFDKLKQELPGVPVFIMGMTTPLKKYVGMTSLRNIIPQNQDFLDTQFREYNDVLMDLAQDYGYFYVDIPGNWPQDIEESWELYAEGLHPNDAGYDLMMNILYQDLLAAVISPETAVSICGSSAIAWGQVKVLAAQ